MISVQQRGTINRVMKSEQTHQITVLLDRLSRGDKEAENHFWEAVHPKLRGLARASMRGERPGHTMRPTELVHEVYMRMVAQPERNWCNRAHFFAGSAKIMRWILIDHAKAKLTAKRGGRIRKINLDEVLVYSDDQLQDFIELDLALQKYEKLDPRGTRVVELHYFGGLTIDETAEELKVSTKTVKRDWRAAKLWLYGELKPERARNPTIAKRRAARASE